MAETSGAHQHFGTIPWQVVWGHVPHGRCVSHLVLGIFMGECTLLRLSLLGLVSLVSANHFLFPTVQLLEIEYILNRQECFL